MIEFIVTIVAIFATAYVVDRGHIRHFVDKPYCETASVAGKEVKRCLKAIEVEP